VAGIHLESVGYDQVVTRLFTFVSTVEIGRVGILIPPYHIRSRTLSRVMPNRVMPWFI
jgi:hypothetical protein